MIRSFLLLVFLILISISCSSFTEKSLARKNLEAYLISLKAGDYEKSYSYFSSEVKEDCKLSQYKKKARNNSEAIEHSRLIFKSEVIINNEVSKINFLIEFNEDKIELFEMAIMDPYIDEETAQFIFENSEWKLNNLIWPVDWCEE